MATTIMSSIKVNPRGPFWSRFINTPEKLDSKQRLFPPDKKGKARPKFILTGIFLKGVKTTNSRRNEAGPSFPGLSGRRFSLF
jgi:hypothetical protein